MGNGGSSDRTRTVQGHKSGHTHSDDLQYTKVVENCAYPVPSCFGLGQLTGTKVQLTVREFSIIPKTYLHL